MSELPPLYQDGAHLRGDQYKDSRNLNARAELHRRFGTATSDWFAWVLERMALAANMQVLEVGAGPGWLWRRHLHRVPAGCRIVLSDLSAGMVAEAEAALYLKNGQFQFQVVNVEEISFPDNQFDLVIANHMLYHVPDLDRGLAEIRRVLRPGGRLVAATNGRSHMQELTELGQLLYPQQEAARPVKQSWAAYAFGLENGRSLLAPWFTDIKRHLYEDSLLVTEVEPLIAYLTSTISSQTVAGSPDVDGLRHHLQRRLAEEGVIHITKSTGLFEAVKEA